MPPQKRVRRRYGKAITGVRTDSALDRRARKLLPTREAPCERKLWRTLARFVYDAAMLQQSMALRLALRAVLVLVALSVPQQLWAQNRAAADALFNAGRDAMTEGDYELACRKFAESNRLDRAVGTLLNLGNCEDKRGRLATAWLRYAEALEMLSESDPRYAFAQRAVEELEPRVPRLIVELAPDAPPETQVHRNRQAIDDVLGVPVRLDPGSYSILVEAPQHEAQLYEVELATGDLKRLQVRPGTPLQLDETSPSAPIAVPPPAPPPSPAANPLGYVFGGLGVASGLTALTFGALTFNQWLTVEDECPTPSNCSSAGYRASQTGKRYEYLYIGFGAAAALSLGAATYFFLSDGDDESAPRIEAGQFGATTGVRVRGRF